jgi:hypothetical protein
MIIMNDPIYKALYSSYLIALAVWNLGTWARINMISYEVYKIIHLFSLIALIMSLTANSLIQVPKKSFKIAGMV